MVLHKEPDENELGQQLFDADGRPRYRCGFRIGGGIDQDPTVSPQGYPDKVPCYIVDHHHNNEVSVAPTGRKTGRQCVTTINEVVKYCLRIKCLK